MGSMSRGIAVVSACVALTLASCSPVVEDAVAEESEALPIVDYYVVYGPVDDVSGEVRNLIGAGWEPVGPLQILPCDPADVCGAQTLIKRGAP